MIGQRLAGIWLAPLCMVIGLIFLAANCQAAPSGSSVAEIIGINGQVEARVGSRAFSTASIFQKLASQDAARTLVSSKAELSFIDQSILVLGPQTTMEIGSYRLGEREGQPARALKILNGKIRFIVNKYFGGGTGEPEFSVDTPTLGVGVRGTDGIIEIKGATDYVYLLQAGKPVLLRSKSTGEQIDLRPGYFAVSQAGLPIRIFPLTEDLRRKLVRELSLAFEIRPMGVTIEQEVTLPTPRVAVPEAGPTQALPPVYTPPVPVTPAPSHSSSPSPQVP
jgi:FecR protein